MSGLSCLSAITFKWSLSLQSPLPVSQGTMCCTLMTSGIGQEGPDPRVTTHKQSPTLSSIACDKFCFSVYPYAWVWELYLVAKTLLAHNDAWV